VLQQPVPERRRHDADRAVDGFGPPRALQVVPADQDLRRQGTPERLPGAGQQFGRAGQWQGEDETDFWLSHAVPGIEVQRLPFQQVQGHDGIPRHDPQGGVRLFRSRDGRIGVTEGWQRVKVALGPRQREQPRPQRARVAQLGYPGAGLNERVTHRRLRVLVVAKREPAVLEQRLRVRVVQLPGRIRGARVEGRGYIG
jgi:hypothetical protein